MSRQPNILQELRSKAWSELGLTLSEAQVRGFAALVAEECAKIAENSIEGHDHMALIHGERSAENIRTAFKVTT